jgi:UDP-N-acetylmuramate dehydrogenase
MDEQRDAALWRYTTLKIGGEATRLCQPSSVNELIKLMDELRKSDEPWFVLGGGSNLLVSSAGVKATVIRTAQLTNMTSPEPSLIQADAGARLPHLARFASSHGLSGLEFSVGIPGTVGGGVIMNAGAHGSQMSNVLEDVTIYDTKKAEIITLKNDELGFEYRRCALDPNVHVVLSARFRLQPQEREQIEHLTKHNEDYRWKTQPLGWPNAGSTFKNPEPKRGAGLLLDQSGAKNMREGSAAVSAVHANFVINMGGATSAEVINLMRKMQERVYNQFEVNLHPEWKTLGDFSQSELEVWRSK